MVKMIALINSFKDKYFKPSMIRWGVVGMATFIIDYSLFIFLFDATKSVYMANLISTTVATAINYYTHHRWTFKTDQNHSRTGLKYLINLMFWWLVSTTIIKTLVVLNIDPRLAKIAPLILIVPVNYFVLNKIVFKKKS
jgi:putative flippase GtrA